MILLVLSFNLIRAQLLLQNFQSQSYESSSTQQQLSLFLSNNKVIIYCQQPDRPLIQIDVTQRTVDNKTQASIRVHDQYKTLLEHQLSNNQGVFITIRHFQGGYQIGLIYLYNEYLILPQTTSNKYGFQEYLKYENQTLKIDTQLTEIQYYKAQQLQNWNNDNGKTINTSQGEIAFHIYSDQGSWIFNDIIYSDCQSVLSSINYKLLTQLGFKNINIYLNLMTVTKNIVCRIENSSNINIIIKNTNQQSGIIDYIFEGFNFIQIINCTFEFQTTFLKSNRVLLRNISITENSSQIQIQSNLIEIYNINCKQTTNSIFQIQSLGVRIIIYDILIQNTFLTAGYLITIPLNPQVTININGIVVTNSTLLNYLFFNLQNYEQLTLCIQNLLIVDSDIINSDSTTYQFLFISKQLQVQNMKILNVNLKKLLLFQAQVVILTNISFIKVQFITTQIMNNNQYLIIPDQISLHIFNIIFEDCSVSKILKQSSFPILFDLYQINININYLSLNRTDYQLFNTRDCLQASFTNIILYNISNHQETTQQIFEIYSQNASITNVTANLLKGCFTIFSIKSSKVQMYNLSIVNFQYQVQIGIIGEIIQIHQLKIISNLIESDLIYLSVLEVTSLSKIYMQECICIVQQPIILFGYLMRIDKFYLEQFGYSQKITDYGLLIVQFMDLTIVNSEFNEVQQTYYNCRQLLDKCSFNFTNNRVKIYKPTVNRLTVFNIESINYMHISKNIFESKRSTQMNFLKMIVLEQCEIIDNIIFTQGQAILIFNQNNSLTLIKNLTIKCYDISITPHLELSTIFIEQGQLTLSNILIMTRAYRIFDLTQQNKISLENIFLWNSNIFIFIRISTDNDLNLLMSNISTIIWNISLEWQDPFFNNEFAFIEVNCLGISNIQILNLIIKEAINYHQVLISLNGQLQLFIDNMRLIKNIFSRHCLRIIDIPNSQNNTSIIIHNSLIYENFARNIFEILVPQISFVNTLVIGSLNSTFVSLLNKKTGSIDIQNSEIVLNNIIPSLKFQYTSYNTRFLELLQIQDQFRVSFDNGKNFAKNMQSDQALNKYQVIFGKNKKYFYIPTGQRLDNFQFLNRHALSYIQYKVKLFFDFKEESKQQLTECKLVYQDYQLNEIFFYLGDQLKQNFTIVAKPRTEINFITVCDIGESKPELQFKAIVMDCQLGEILIHGICLPCDVQLQLYSVKHHSIQCYPLNEISMKSVYRALIELNPGYWRPHFTNDQIETCTPQQDSCKGGLVFGNQLCKEGYIGAICSECDLFRNQNQQSYTKNLWQICNPCNVTLLQISKQAFSFVMYKYLYIRSAILLFMTVISYYQTTKKNILITISWPTYQKIFKWQFDSLGIWIALLSLYCQNLINVNQNSILSLAPFYIDYDFITNTSFNFMNLLDCVFASSFRHDYWIYIRIVFMIANYGIIFELFVMILLLSQKKNKISYSLILLTMPIINIYNGNILSIFTYLILLLLPIEYSGKKYIQADLQTSDMQLHKIMTVIFILPLTLIIVVVLPIIYFFKIRNNINDNTLRNHFRYLSYLFKKNAYYFELLSKLFSFMIILEIYALKKYIFEKLFILIVLVNLQYFAFAYIQPYYSKKLNNWNLTIVLMFDTQLIISGLIDQTSHTLQFILSLIFYLISAFVILYSLVQIILQINDEYYESFDKLRRTIVRYIGDKFLKEHRLFRIRRYYSIIRENVRTRRRRNPQIHQIE